MLAEAHAGSPQAAATSAGSVAEAIGTNWFRDTVPCSGFDNQGSDPASPSWSRASRRQLFRGCRYPRHRRLGDPPKPDDRNRSGNRKTQLIENDSSAAVHTPEGVKFRVLCYYTQLLDINNLA